MPLRPIPAPPLPRPLRLPDVALPAYRYVPGLNPHPFRHPAGHMYTDGQPPAERPDAVAHQWLHGLDLYDHRFYWEAHEAWEACWHVTPPGAERTLQQGLIQCAAAVLKRHMAHHSAAERLRSAAVTRLVLVEEEVGRFCRGVDVAGCRSQFEAHFRGGVDWPVIVDDSTGTPGGYTL